MTKVMNLNRLMLLVTLLAIASFFTVQASEQVSFKTDNGVINLADLKGKVVYIDFWASWCKPCRKSFPWMNSMQARYEKQGLKIIAINLDKERPQVEKFLKAYKADFTIAYDPDAVLAQLYKVKGMPSSYMISRKGELIFSHIGFRESDAAALEDKIKKALAEK